MKKLGKLKLYPSKEIERSVVSIGFECLDRDAFNPEKCYDLLGQSGVKYARCQTGWAKCEKEKGVFDFAWLDRIVDQLLLRGVEPWFSVSYGNPIYMKDAPNATAVGCVPMFFGQEAMSAWKRYVEQLCIHFSGRVRLFEIWNEPDGADFWYPERPNGAKYALLVTETAKIIKRVIPDAKTGGCISAIKSTPLTYIVDFARAVTAEALDFLCYHAYDLYPEEEYLPSVRNIRRIFLENGLPDTELWQGEAGFSSWFPEKHWLHPTKPGTQRKQAVFMLRRYFLDMAAGAKISSFFQMVDMWEKPYEKAVEVLKKPAAQGILNGITYTPKQSYETIRHLAVLLSGSVKPIPTNFGIRYFDPAQPTRQSVCISLLRNDRPLYAYYSAAEIENELTACATADVRIPAGMPEDPVLIDTYSGEVFDISKMCGEENGVMLFRQLPISDYPMVICSRDVYAIQ